jgi:hypothetical protein
MSGRRPTSCDGAGGIPRRTPLREHAPQVLGAVIRRYRDFAASEDACRKR